MKKVCLFLTVAIACVMLLWPSAAQAADVAKGAEIFSAHCNACHLGGKNVVNGTKTLSKSALEKYEMLDLEKIKNQVTNGKAAMPAFKGRLKPDQIENVASYVLEKANKGW